MTTNKAAHASVSASPQLSDLLRMWKRDIFLSLNCHQLGKIQSFDSVKQTATATISMKQSFNRLNSNTGVYDEQLVEYPLLADCPVFFLGGGNSFQTFPVVAGDDCLILYNDRDIDNWALGSNDSAPKTPRAHSISDGMILVFKRGITGFDTDGPALRNNTAGVKVGSNNVKLYNDSHTLGDLLQDLITAVKAITVTCAGSGSPSSTPINASSLTSIANKLEDLLQ